MAEEPDDSELSKEDDDEQSPRESESPKDETVDPGSQSPVIPDPYESVEPSATADADADAKVGEEDGPNADADGGGAGVPNADGGEDVPVGHAAGATRPGSATTVGEDDPFDDDDGFDKPPDDEEMPLAMHIEEMVHRLGIVILAAAAASALAIPFSEEIIVGMWYDLLPAGQEITRPHLYSPLELVLTKIKVASLAGIVVALPLFVYESYLFMRPGLYPRERRYYLASVPVSLVLAVAGMAFAYLLMLPALFEYFLYYTEGSANVAFALSDTFNLIVTLMGFQAIVFQIPLLIMLAIMMGITTREWLVGRRLLFWGAFLGIAFLFSPDPTGVAPFIVAGSMIGLFEGTLQLLKWTQDSSPIPTADELADRRLWVWAFAGAVGYVLSPAPVPNGYYVHAPQVLIDALGTFGLGPATPLLLSAAAIVLYEAVAYTNKNYYGSVRLWRGLRKARLPFWLVALVAGSLASPGTTLATVVSEPYLSATGAATVAVGLVVLFEGGLAVARWRGGTPEDDVE
ncbi:twin-arginine translocase subunit TatC [Haloarchaeobius sp. HRN-SO-5]|uniref:twin-arginine translocase subunit TatC n=1 Tax=Haloarchaeobius sp. HRN-SO-5 TaxID=3446118 RepID=UPI003EBF405C